MNAGTRLINLAVSLTYFIGVNYNCMDCSSKFWPNNLGTGDSFCVKLRAGQMQNMNTSFSDLKFIK